MAKSIFKFADKFGYESPFGDWLKRDKDNEQPTIVSISAYLNIGLIKFNRGKIFSKKIDTYDHKKQKSIKKNVEVGYYEDNLHNRIIPIFLIIEVTGFPSRVEVEQAGKKSPPQKWGIKSYRISTSVIFYSLFQEYQDINFNISLFNQNEKTDVQTFSVRVFPDGYLGDSNMEMEEEFANEIETERFNKICGGEYRGKMEGTAWSGYYGPVYYGNQPLKFYKGFDKLLKEGILTKDDKDILVAMSENEGNLDAIQSWDSEILTAGAMQKTVRIGGDGEFEVQVFEFKQQFSEKFKTLLENCYWKVEEKNRITKMSYKGIEGKELRNLIRAGYDRSTIKKKKDSTPLLPIIKLLNDPDFQAKQLIDFIDRMEQALAKKPDGYTYKIAEYFKSNLGKALVLDHDVNKKNYVKSDFAKALNTFYEKNSTVPKNPNEWKEKHKEYEKKLIEIYASVRRMTDAEINKQRYNHLKQKLG